MTAVTFTIMSLFDGEHLGFGVICAAARYCSLRLGRDRIERRFLPLDRWKAVEAEIALNLPPEPLEVDSAIVAAFAGERRWVIQYLHAMPIDVPPANVAAALDALLTSHGEAAQRKDP